MVLLTMTPSIVDCIKSVGQVPKTVSEQEGPSLDEPAVGKPISHGQVVFLWKSSKGSSLEVLLRGSQVYVPPPAPKSEPSDEFKALMARLRREEDARAYERMVNAPPPLEMFKDRFPSSARAFAAVNKPTSASDLGDDDVTYNEVHRQVMLIINFLVSIAGVAATLWVVGRWWSLPARIFLTMGGSIAVAIAEVTVYSSYVWRLGESKKKSKGGTELKEVLNTWQVGGGGDTQNETDEKSVTIQSKKDDIAGQVKRRAARSGDQDGAS